ncbi:hypothetical protein SAMN05443580_13710 [Variovorax sp. OV084]|nr:hypothetical protein SAMN05443580_13710 [Variovorax sp. OV084]
MLKVRLCDQTLKLSVLSAVFFCNMVSAADLPCDIHDFRVEGATIKVFFSEKASWRVGSRGDRIIAGAKSLYFDEMQQDDVVIEEEGLTLGDGASVNLSIPHIVCTLTAVLEQPTPGLRVSESSSLPGIPGTTDSVFLPAKHRR